MYSVRRFSYSLVSGINKGSDYINSQVDTGLNTIENLSTKITEDPNLKDLKPVKRWGRLLRDSSYLLKKQRKEKKN